MTEQKTNVSAGAGFLSLLTILFIGLKLTGHITWSWWWVLAPLWMQLALLLIIIIVLLIVTGISELVK